eukprot:scaffold32902_cov101-Isochrysis_galbana.AAC.1
MSRRAAGPAIISDDALLSHSTLTNSTTPSPNVKIAFTLPPTAKSMPLPGTPSHPPLLRLNIDVTVICPTAPTYTAPPGASLDANYATSKVEREKRAHHGP